VLAEEASGAPAVAVATALTADIEYHRAGEDAWRSATEVVVLRAGDSLRTKGAGRAEVVFRSGERYVLAPETLVVLREDGPEIAEGEIEIRERTGLAPLLAPLLTEEGAEQRAAADRVRRLTVPSPFAVVHQTVPREDLPLEVIAMPGADRYRVTLQEATAQGAFLERTTVDTGASMTVPADSLRAGVSYYWAVEGLAGRERIVGRRAGTFETLPEEAQRAWERLVAKGSSAGRVERWIRARYEERLGCVTSAGASELRRIALAGGE
jgi:hypothetical protein